MDELTTKLVDAYFDRLERYIRLTDDYLAFGTHYRRAIFEVIDALELIESGQFFNYETIRDKLKKAIEVGYDNR